MGNARGFTKSPTLQDSETTSLSSTASRGESDARAARSQLIGRSKRTFFRLGYGFFSVKSGGYVKSCAVHDSRQSETVRPIPIRNQDPGLRPVSESHAHHQAFPLSQSRLAHRKRRGETSSSGVHVGLKVGDWKGTENKISLEIT